MKRSEMLYCADCDVPRYKLLDARDQLPAIIFRSGEDEDTQKHRSYTLAHSLLLRLTLDLIGADVRKNPLLTGVPASTASKIMANLSREVMPELENPSADYWIGQLVIREVSNDRAYGAIDFNEWFLGPLCDLPCRISEESESPEASERSVVRCNIVNVARAVEFVQRRAEDLCGEDLILT